MTENTSTRVPVKTAVSNALNYIRTLYSGTRLEDLLLEEVEFSEETNQWLITVGFTIISSKTQVSSVSLIPPKRDLLVRHYKIVRIDAQTGEPVSMKIREI